VGASTAVIMYCVDGTRRVPVGSSPDRDATERLLVSLFPGRRLVPAGEVSLGDASVQPSDGLVCAGSFPGAEIVCAGALADFERTAEIPRRFLTPGAGRRTHLLRMLSSVDFLSFAVWVDGLPVRALSLDPDNGLLENLGSPLPFEEPFWAGEHPVEDDLEEFDVDLEPVGRMAVDPEAYPFPFDPLELGEEALRALFGFVLEGVPRDDDIDPFEVPLLAFHAF
jgi:hypothetical protein